MYVQTCGLDSPNLFIMGTQSFVYEFGVCGGSGQTVDLQDFVHPMDPLCPPPRLFGSHVTSIAR